MLKNYLKIALRNLVRRKTFSLINTLGLAFGIAACLIIYMYVSYERSYDTFNKNADMSGIMQAAPTAVRDASRC
jgi:putative ABC transport system permease protein